MRIMLNDRGIKPMNAGDNYALGSYFWGWYCFVEFPYGEV